MAATVTHQAKAGATLTGAEYESAAHHVVSITAADIGAAATSHTHEAFPVGSVFIAVVSTNPATLLGYGTWAAFAAGRVLIGNDGATYNPDESTGGATTAAVSAHAGAAVANHAAQSHSGATVADHAAQSHSAHAGATVSDHASHTHTYTDVPNHTHPHNMQGGTTGATTGTNVMGSTATGGSARAMAIATSNNTGGVATGTTAGPGATLTHTVGQASAHSDHAALTHTIGQASDHAALAHTVTQPSDHTAVSTVQPYIVVHMWKRTA